MIERRRLGSLELVSIDDGGFRLDGGSMFGVVPRAMWARESPPDEENRIDLRARPLLVQGPFGNLLVEAGLGDAGDDRFRARHSVDFPRGLEAGLREAGVAPEEIDFVVMSHLHWDHAGGLVRQGAGGALEAAFPRAVHFVQDRTWEAALRPGPRSGSHHPDRLEPLADLVRLERVRGEHEVVAGVRFRPVGGHCEDHAAVVIASEGETAVFLGDLVPTASHFPTPWIMAFDLFPAKTFEEKPVFLAECCEAGWVQVLYHDPNHAFGRLEKGERERLVFIPE